MAVNTALFTELYIILKQWREYISWKDSYTFGQIEEEEIDSHLMGIEVFISTAFAQNTVLLWRDLYK